MQATLQSPTRPHWAMALSAVLLCGVVAGLLALLTQWYQGVSRSGLTGPVELTGLSVLPLLGRGSSGPQPAMSPSQALARGDWQAAAQPLAMGWPRDPVWVRLGLHSRSDRAQTVWLEVSPSRLTRLRLHSPLPDVRWHSQASGNALIAAERPLNMAELVFPLSLAGAEQRTVLVEIDTRTDALNLVFDLYTPETMPGLSQRANLLDMFSIGGSLLLSVLGLCFAVAARQLTLVLVALRVGIGGLWNMQQFGAGALFLSASMNAALADAAPLLAWATLVLTVAFNWACVAYFGLSAWAHRAYACLLFGAMLLGAMLLVAVPSGRLHGLVLLPLLLLTCTQGVRQVFAGHWPVLALLVGGLTAVVVNSPVTSFFWGGSFTGVSRYYVSALPFMLTSIVLFVAIGVRASRAQELARTQLLQIQAEALQRLEGLVVERTAALQSALDRAEIANQTKSIFLAKVSHELRTPMHSVLGYLDLALRSPMLPALQARQLHIARQAGRQLVRQINDLLDGARSDQSALRLVPERVDLLAWAQDVRDQALLLSPANGNHFALHCAADLPVWVWADGPRLEQVLMVLLSNAMRYTQHGQIDLRILCVPPPAGRPEQAPFDTDTGPEAAPADALWLHFEVHDTGRGIVPGLLPRLGRAFERGASDDPQGLGLGLAIVGQWLALMRTRLEIISQPGAGSCFGFTLRLPLAPLSPERVSVAAEPAPPSPVAEPLGMAADRAPSYVLVLEEDPINLAYLTELLHHEGFHAHGFAKLADALAALHAGRRAGEPPPGLCIVDQQLLQPDSQPAQQGAQSGWQFLQALRSLAGTPGVTTPWSVACPVLMVSAAPRVPPVCWPEQWQPSHHLLKPVDQRRLLAVVRQMLGLLPAEPAAEQAGVAAAADLPPAADPQVWQALIDLAEAGSVSGLDEWAGTHAGLLAADARLAQAVLGLSFGGLAQLARAALDIR